MFLLIINKHYALQPSPERPRVPAIPRAFGIATQVPCFLDLTSNRHETSGLRHFVRQDLCIQRSLRGRGRGRSPGQFAAIIRAASVQPRRKKFFSASTASSAVLVYMPTQVPCFLDLAFNASGISGLRCFVRENLWIQDHQGEGEAGGQVASRKCCVVKVS